MHFMSLTPYFRWLLIIAAVPLLLLLYFSPNIWGYMRFQHYCETQGGFKVYEKLEKDKGWLTEDLLSAEMASFITGVAFARYKNAEDNTFYDVRYIGGRPGRRQSFSVEKADLSQEVKYRYKVTLSDLPNETRLSSLVRQVFDISNNTLVIEHKRFGYSLFDQNNTLLQAPSGNACHHSDSFVNLISEQFQK